MRVIVDIREEKLPEFWQYIRDQQKVEGEVLKEKAEASHIQEILRRRQDPTLSATVAWDDINHKYARKRC